MKRPKKIDPCPYCRQPSPSVKRKLALLRKLLPLARWMIGHIDTNGDPYRTVAAHKQQLIDLIGTRRRPKKFS